MIALRCRACGEDHELGPVLGATFDAAFGVYDHTAIKDGGEPTIETCPECGERTYVIAESRCAACDFLLPERYLAICGADLSAYEYAEYQDLCGYDAYITAKDD